MSEIICHCFEVSREEIENAIREKGLKTVEEVGEVTNAGTGCGGLFQCHIVHFAPPQSTL